MRTDRISSILLVFLMTIVAVLSPSCKKSPDSGSGPGNSQRIVSVDYFANGVDDGREMFNYSGNQIVSVISYDSGNILSVKDSIIYANGKISGEIWYAYTNGVWVKRGLSEVNGYSGAYPLQIIYHNYDQAGQETSSKYEYTYTGGILTSDKYYHLENGSWIIAYSTTYIYDGDGLLGIELDYSDTATSPSWKTTYSWTGDLLDTLISWRLSDSIWEAHSKQVLSYAGGKTSNSAHYYMNNGIWVPTYSYAYEYNSLGNLSKRTETSQGPSKDVYSYVINYSDGSGNFRDIITVLWGDYYFKGYPWPVPVKTEGVANDVMQFRKAYLRHDRL
jgi:hypothetical protein